MELHRAERDYYSVSITVDPELDGTWEASFDGGTTWADGTLTLSDWTWLVAGPDFNPTTVGMSGADTAATVTASTVPLLRIKDNPILDVEKGPKITLWR